MSGGAGGGKGTTQTSTESSPLSPFLAQQGLGLLKQVAPLSSDLTSQFMEALRTGGVTTSLPIINRALDASRRAASTTVEQTRQQVARSGMARSTEGQAQISEAEQTGEEKAAAIPQQFAMELIKSAPGWASTMTGEGLRALMGAVASTMQSRGTSQQGFWDYFMQGLQSGGQLGLAYALA